MSDKLKSLHNHCKWEIYLFSYLGMGLSRQIDHFSWARLLFCNYFLSVLFGPFHLLIIKQNISFKVMFNEDLFLHWATFVVHLLLDFQHTNVLSSGFHSPFCTSSIGISGTDSVFWISSESRFSYNSRMHILVIFLLNI